MAQAFNKTGVGNFLENTSAGKTIDTITDFIPILGTLKNLGLGAYSLFDDDKENADWGRIVGGGLGAIAPFGLGALGKGLGKGAIKAGTKIAAGTAGKGGATLANLLKGGATVANWGAKTGLGRTVATGVGTQLGKGQANAVETDLKQQAETADIMNSDLVTGKYLDTLLGDLNTETVSEYDKYAQDLAIKEEQDKANAVYSGMNAGNAGLSNLLKGNIANAYSQLSKQALGELAKQKSSNKLSAMNQTDNQFNSLLSLAQSTGNSDLLEKLLLAKTNQLTKGN